MTRWTAILVASFFLFLTNWGILAFDVAISREWELLPIGAHLAEIEKSGHPGFAQGLGLILALFLIIIILRTYVGLLLLDQDQELSNQLFIGASKTVLGVEFLIRCFAVISLNLLYLSLTGRGGEFRYWLLATTVAFILWDVVMLTRIREGEMSSVIKGDALILISALVYFFSETYQGPSLYTPIPFVIFGSVGVVVFLYDLRIVYWRRLRRVFSTRWIIRPPV